MGEGRRLALTGGGWIVVGLASGLQAHVASALGAAPVPLMAAVRLQILAAAPWIPATYAAFALAAAYPVTRARWPRRLLLHLAAGVAAVVALNLAIIALQGAAGPASHRSVDLVGDATKGVLTLGHMALVVWAGLVTAGHLIPAVRRRASPEAQGAVVGTAEPGERARDPLDLRDHKGRVLLDPIEIRWIEADGDYVRIHDRSGGEHLVSARMSELERRLAADGFARIHRSFIVNLDRVRRHFPRSHGDHVLELDDGVRLPLPRGRRDSVLNRLPGRSGGGSRGRQTSRDGSSRRKGLEGSPPEP